MPPMSPSLLAALFDHWCNAGEFISVSVKNIGQDTSVPGIILSTTGRESLTVFSDCARIDGK